MKKLNLKNIATFMAFSPNVWINMCVHDHVTTSFVVGVKISEYKLFEYKLRLSNLLSVVATWHHCLYKLRTLSNLPLHDRQKSVYFEIGRFSKLSFKNHCKLLIFHSPFLVLSLIKTN